MGLHDSNFQHYRLANKISFVSIWVVSCWWCVLQEIVGCIDWGRIALFWTQAHCSGMCLLRGRFKLFSSCISLSGIIFNLLGWFLFHTLLWYKRVLIKRGMFCILKMCAFYMHGMLFQRKGTQIWILLRGPLEEKSAWLHELYFARLIW